MRQRIKLRYAILFLISFAGCLEEDVLQRDYPVLVTNPVTEISPYGATLSGVIESGDVSQILDHGFVWGLDSTLNLNVSNFAKLGSPTGRNFSATIGSTLVNQVRYYCRSYAVLNGKTIYGNIVKFKSQGSEGPIVSRFEPAAISLGDTLRIVGKNFVAKTETNVVMIHDQKAKVVDATDTTLHVIVPLKLFNVTNPVKVSIGDRTTTAADALQIFRPSVSNILNKNFTLCDTITLEGTHLNSLGPTTKVRLNGDTVRIISMTENRIRMIPLKRPVSNIQLYISNNAFISTQIFNHSLQYIAPVVLQVTPEEYWPGETITITGTNFPACEAITTAVEDYTDGYQKTYTTELLSQSPTEIKLKINDNEKCLSSFRISISAKGETVTTPFLRYAKPEILSIEPNTASLGEMVTITGKKLFASDINYAFVNFLDLVEVSETEYKGKVRSTYAVNGIADVELQSCHNQAYLEGGFTFTPPQIFNVSPANLTDPTGYITIDGKGLGSFVTVHVGDKHFSMEVFNDQIMFPAWDVIPIPNVSYSATLSVEVETETGYRVAAPQPLTIDYKTRWTKLADYPEGGRSSVISFSINGKGYVGYGNASGSLKNEFYEYDPLTNHWTKLTDMSSPKSNMRSAATSSKGYAGLSDNSNEWNEFDPASATWTSKTNFPGDASKSRFVFADDQFVYVSYNLTSQPALWKYDPAFDQWTQLTTVPANFWGEPVAFSFKGKIYMYGMVPGSTSTTFREFVYDPLANTWQANVVNPFSFTYHWDTYVFQDFVVVYNPNLPSSPHHPNLSNQFYKITPGQSSWQALYYYGPPRVGGIAFMINQVAYFGLGSNSLNLNIDFFSFDPSK
jgi:N-acetylneuraminic acid mutarotase